MLSNELCEKLLAIPRPWRIRHVKADRAQQRLLVDLALERAGRGWFSRDRRGECPFCGRSVPVPKDVKPLVLRHINLGTYQVYLRFEPPGVDCARKTVDCPLRLEAAPSMRYTQGLRNRIQPFWDSAQGSAMVSRLLDLAPSELEQLRNASAPAQSPPPAVASATTRRTVATEPSAPPPAAEPQTAPARPNDVPPATHPAWQGLIDRTITLQTKNFALQMLLTWAGSQGQDDAAESTRLSKISMLRAYFEKHRQDLTGEIEQLFGSGGST